MANVSGKAVLSINVNQVPSTTFLAGQANSTVQINEIMNVVLANGVAADQFDGLYANTFTFVASTPQTLDLATLTDIFGVAITAVRARLVAFKVRWTTDNVPLLAGNAGANEWDGLCSASGTVKVYPSSAKNDGWVAFAAPQTTGMVINPSTAHLLKLDPQTAAGQVDVIIATCST